MKGYDEDMAVFKSYLRRMLSDLKNLKVAIEAHDEERALEIVNSLIRDTQAGIED